jgi:hypothetical protein
MSFAVTCGINHQLVRQGNADRLRIQPDPVS